MTPQPDAGTRPARVVTRARRMRLLGVVGALLAVGIGLWLVWFMLRPDSASQVAERFLQGIETADADSWHPVLSPALAERTDETGATPLIGDPALRDLLAMSAQSGEPRYARADDPSAEVTESEADTAIIPVQLSYELPGDSARTAVPIELVLSRLSAEGDRSERQGAWRVSSYAPTAHPAEKAAADSACATPTDVLVDLSDVARIEGDISTRCTAKGVDVSDLLGSGVDAAELASGFSVLTTAHPVAELLWSSPTSAALSAYRLDTASGAYIALISSPSGGPSALLALRPMSGAPATATAAAGTVAPDDAIWFAMNQAMAADDREGFLAQASGDGRAALERWWDNTKALGWRVAAVTPKWVADDGGEATIILGAQLPFAPESARGSGRLDAGLAQVQGAYYSVRLEGAGAQRRITSMAPMNRPEVWDEGELHVQRREHVVLFGRSDESALVDAEADVAERAAVQALALLDELGGTVPVDGFLVAITDDAARLRHWQFGSAEPWAMSVAAFARPMVRPDVAREWLDPRLATGSTRSSGTVIVLGPRSADDREQNLVHEFAHAMLNAANPDLSASSRAAVTEGFARYVEWRSGLTTPRYATPAVREAVARHGAEAFSTERLRGERSWVAYAAAGSYYAFVADSGGDVWQLAVEARADADGLEGYASRHPDLSIQKWQEWVAQQ